MGVITLAELCGGHVHVAPEDFIEVTDVVEAGHPGDFADAVPVLCQEIGADGNAVEVQIIGQRHPGHGSEEPAEMALAHMHSFRHFPETDLTPVVLLQINENRFDMVGGSVFSGFWLVRGNGAGGKRMPYFQEPGLDQQFKARRFLGKEIPDRVEKRQKFLLPCAVGDNVFRKLKPVFKDRGNIFPVDVVTAGAIQKGGGEDQSEKAERLSRSPGCGVERAGGDDDDILFPNVVAAAGNVNSGASPCHHKNFQFFVPVIPDALLHPEGGGYLVEGNGKEGGSMADRFMESRKITQRFVWHRGSL